MLSEVSNLDASSKNSLSSFISLAPNFDGPSPCFGGTGGGDVDGTCTDGAGSRFDHLLSLLSSALSGIGSNLGMQIGDGVLMF